jgi:hypothetical protein
LKIGETVHCVDSLLIDQVPWKKLIGVRKCKTVIISKLYYQFITISSK